MWGYWSTYDVHWYYSRYQITLQVCGAVPVDPVAYYYVLQYTS